MWRWLDTTPSRRPVGAVHDRTREPYRAHPKYTRKDLRMHTSIPRPPLVDPRTAPAPRGGNPVPREIANARPPEIANSAPQRPRDVEAEHAQPAQGSVSVATQSIPPPARGARVLDRNPRCSLDTTPPEGRSERHTTDNRSVQSAPELAQNRCLIGACGGTCVPGNTRRPPLRKIAVSILALSGASEHAPGASRVSIDTPRRAPVAAPSACHTARSAPDQIEDTGATRGPRRPKRLVATSQGCGDRPAPVAAFTQKKHLANKART